MATPDSVGPEVILETVNKIAMELVFAEAGKDNGLLPTNSLWGDLEPDDAAQPLNSSIAEAVKLGRQWIDAVFEVGVFDAGSLRRLRDLVTWLQSALNGVSAGQPIPALPAFDEKSPTANAPDSKTTRTETSELPQEDSMMLNLEEDAELLGEFSNESQEHLQNIELGVLTLEDNPTDADTLNSIFRAFHTFKGGSGFLNLIPINRLAHELESLLDLARQDKLRIDSSIINIILAGGDTLKKFITEIEAQLTGTSPVGPIQIPTQELLGQIRRVVEAELVKAESPVRAPADEVEDNLPETPVGLAVDRSVRAENEVEALAPAKPAATTPTKPKPRGDTPAASSAPQVRAVAAASSVKVDTLKLDSLVDLVGEMVIAQSMVAQDESLQSIESRQLSRNLAQLSRITKELQRVSMSLRMVPIRGTFQKMTRLVRDLSIKSGKQVELDMHGEDTELDRTIVEEISDPLVHMIRNAADHGIEKAETRLAAGKTPFGTIRLRAFHKGGNIVIEIKDDGAGLDRERILAKAVERGIADPDSNLPDKEVFAFIFAAGFSTAAKVTDVSGRGVGMDVVRRNIEKLRGKVEIDSVAGKGTTFSIHLPLTLAIIDGLIVSVGEERYIIPTLAVRESFRPTAEMVSTVQERGELVNVRGHLMPLLRLSEVFGVTPKSEKVTESISVVVESATCNRCLLVDNLLGKQEVVIKSLGETFKGNPGLAGAAILGDGRVGLILDIEGVARLARNPLAQAA